MKNYTDGILLRFSTKVEVSKPTGCWLWTAGLMHKGYGIFWLQGKTERAHRVGYCLHNDVPISEILGLDILHSCDNPLCVNGEHLSLGTNDDNVADKCKKNRQYRPKGELNSRSKLTESQVRQVHDLRNTSGLTHLAIAKRFGLARSTVGAILSGENWSHVKATL